MNLKQGNKMKFINNKHLEEYYRELFNIDRSIYMEKIMIDLNNISLPEIAFGTDTLEPGIEILTFVSGSKPDLNLIIDYYIDNRMVLTVMKQTFDTFGYNERFRSLDGTLFVAVETEQFIK